MKYKKNDIIDYTLTGPDYMYYEYRQNCRKVPFFLNKNVLKIAHTIISPEQLHRLYYVV